MKRPLNPCRWGGRSENHFWGDIKVHPRVSSRTKTFVRNEPPEQRRESEEQPGEEKSSSGQTRHLRSALLQFHHHLALSLQREQRETSLHVSRVSSWTFRGTASIVFLLETGISCFNNNVFLNSRLQLEDMCPPFFSGQLLAWFPSSANKPFVFPSNKLTLVMSGKLKR